jgi:Trp operon repressor
LIGGLILRGKLCDLLRKYLCKKILVLMQLCIIIVNVTLKEVFMSPQQMILSLLDKKITQAQIAEEVGVDQSTISRYPKGDADCGEQDDPF